MHDGRPAAALLGLGSEWALLDLPRETLSASGHTRRKPACFECGASQTAYFGESSSTPSGHIERHPGPKRALLVRTRNKPPPAAQRYDVAVSQFENYLRLKNIRGAENLSATESMRWRSQICVQ